MLDEEIVVLDVRTRIKTFMSYISTKSKLDADAIAVIILSLTLIIMSFVFYRERIIFTDTAVSINHIIQKEQLFVATNRYISIFTQILPWLGVQLNLPLKTILILFSFNYILIPLLLSWLCLIIFKDRVAAWGILLLYIVSNIWLFYYPVSEFQTGLALLIFYNAYWWHHLRTDKRSYAFVFVSLLLITTIIFSHPLTILVFIAWWLWFLLHYSHKRNIQMLLPLVFAIVAYVIKEHFFKAMVGNYDYETHRKEGLVHFSEPIITYFNNNLSRTMLSAWKDHYLLTLALLFGCFSWLAYCREWKKIIYWAILLLGFWILITVNFKFWSYNEYLEHMYQPLTFFLVLPIAHYLHRIISSSITRNIVLCFLSSMIIIKIINNNQEYRKRHEWYMTKIEKVRQKGLSKAVLSLDQSELLNYDQTWASSSETLLLSALDDIERPIVLIFRRNETDVNQINSEKQFYNNRYFKIEEGTLFIDMRKK